MGRRKVVILGQGKDPTAAMPPAAATPTSRPLNPKYIPPQGDRCLIEELILPEVLAYIFELGTRSEEDEDGERVVEEDDGDEAFEDVDSDDETDEDDLRPMEMGRVKITDDTDKDGSDAENTRYLPFQVRMSHVCRRWRHVAIDTPGLWTKLTFEESAPFEKSKEWIVRSRQCPLDITIDISLPDEYSPLVGEVMRLQDGDASGDGGRDNDRELDKAASQDLEHIFDAIIPHVSRWRTFEISVDAYSHMYIALERLEGCSATPGAPLLETLSLFCHDDSEDPEFEHFVFSELRHHFLLFGGNAPKLSLVGLWGVHLDWNMFIPPCERSVTSMQTPPIAFTNLTDLELAYHARDVRPSYNDFVNILRCATNLSSLKLSCSGPYILQNSVVEPLFLPALRNLRLAILDVSYACLILRLIYAPGLTNISLDFDENDFTQFVQRLISPMTMPSFPPPHFKELIRLPPGSASSRDVRLVDPTKPVSILASVTDAKLSGLPCADSIVDTFYTACPRLTRLYLNMHFLPLMFFSLLVQKTKVEHTTVNGRAIEAARIVMPSGPGSGPALTSSESARLKAKGTLVCPHLEALTVSGMNGSSLKTLVETRKALGAPLRELNIDKMDAPEVTAAEFFWLRNNVQDLHLVDISDDEDGSDESEDEDEDDEEDDEEDEDEDDEDHHHHHNTGNNNNNNDNNNNDNNNNYNGGQWW